MKKQIFIKPGDKLYYLTAIKYLYTGKHHRRYFLFKCDCGKEKILQAGNVTSGNTRSCGCYGHKSRKAQLKPNNSGVIHQIVLGYKRHARDRNLIWDLSHEEVREIINSPCHYCGEIKSNLKITKNCKEGYRYNGIDRIDSSKNYTFDNVVPCCKTCNSAKRDMSKENFLIWINRVYDYQKAMADQWGRASE